MREGDVELNAREIDEQDSQALGFDGLAVDDELDARHLRRDIGERRLKVGDGPERLLCGLGVVHDGGVVTGTRHDSESEAFPRNLDFAEVEIERVQLARHVGERERLDGREQVRGQKVARAGGEGQDGDARAGEPVRNRGYRSVPSGCDDRVVFVRVVEHRRDGCSAIGVPQAHLVAVDADHAQVIVYRAIAIAGRQVVDYEQLHNYLAYRKRDGN